MTTAKFTPDTGQKVMVTGATGYVAGWIVHDLLAAGVTVHATVRNPEDGAKVGFLTEMAAELPGELHLFRADLLEPGSFAAAMEGCRTVFHTASPFTTRVSDPQRDLVDPALEGTRNVLGQASATASVKRVVLTSSVVAMAGDAADIKRLPGGVLSEAAWNDTSSLEHQPYAYSKVLAEREAWKIAEAQSQWDMVVINPGFVLGPALGPSPTSESFSVISAFGDGRAKMGAPRFPFGVIDVRDLAQAHLAAAYIPGAQGRHIVLAHETDMYELSKPLRDEFGAHPLPRMASPKWLFWLIGPALAGISRRVISANVGHGYRADNSKAVSALGMEFRPLGTTITDMFRQMVQRGTFDKVK